MLIYDPAFLANSDKWRALLIPYVACSDSTDYVTLDEKGTFVVDYPVPAPAKAVKLTTAGGDFDLEAEYLKSEGLRKEAELEAGVARSKQSLQDGGKAKLLQAPQEPEYSSDGSTPPKHAPRSDSDELSVGPDPDDIVIF